MIDPIEDAGFTRIDSLYMDLNLAQRDSTLLVEIKKFKGDKRAARISGNHLDERLISELRNLFRYNNERQGIDGVILTSGHRVAFSRGAKIERLLEIDHEECNTFITKAQDLTRLIQNCPFPVVAAINGLTFGGGLEIALACDYRVAGNRENVALALPEAHLGLLPAMGGVVNGKRLIGREMIYDMIYNLRFDIFALDALALGLVDDVAEQSDLIGEAYRFLLEKGGQKAIPPIVHTEEKSSEEYQREIREYLSSVDLPDPSTLKIAPYPAVLLPFLLDHIDIDNLNEALRYEREVFLFLQQTEDCREGIQALIDERDAHFQGK